MADIFISYASADRERARVLAEALAGRGHAVWWDRTIPPGRVFDEVIQEALQAARCVIVLWSSESVKSNWVKTEAAEGVAQNKLVPATIEAVLPPIEFKRIQAADLSNWSGAPDHPEFRKLLGAIERLLEAAPAMGRAAAPAPATSRARASRLTLLKIMAIVGAIGLIASAATRWMSERTQQAAPPSAPAAEPGPGAERAPVEPSAPPAGSSAAARAPLPAGRVNLLAPDEGGEIVTASNERWMLTVDGKEDTYAWVDTGEAVFAFRDGRAATFDTFAVLVPGAGDNNLRKFELLASNDAGGPFQPIGTFSTQNLRIMKNPFQEFRFDPVTARYLKVRALESHSGSAVSIAHEFRLYGKTE